MYMERQSDKTSHPESQRIDRALSATTLDINYLMLLQVLFDLLLVCSPQVQGVAIAKKQQPCSGNMVFEDVKIMKHVIRPQFVRLVEQGPKSVFEEDEVNIVRVVREQEFLTTSGESLANILRGGRLFLWDKMRMRRRPGRGTPHGVICVIGTTTASPR